MTIRDHSVNLQITLTRRGDWIIEAPCGWSENYGDDLFIDLAREIARHHRRRCLNQRCRRARIGWEVHNEEGVAS